MARDVLELAARWCGERDLRRSGALRCRPGTDLAPIELYTADTRIVGWISSNGQRVTDLLLASDELHLWHPSPGPSASRSITPAASRSSTTIPASGVRS